MADMGDISALIGMLTSADGGGQAENASPDGENAENSGDGGFFGSIDPEMLIKLIEVFSRLNETDKNTELIMALKPHLRRENQPKADRAAQLMKLMSALTVFKDMNIF